MILAAILYGAVALLGVGLLIERRARNRQDARDAARLAEIRANADRARRASANRKFYDSKGATR